VIDPARLAEDPHVVLHWYDFLCPFCYVGQHRTKILVQRGFEVIELPFQAHPEIPPAGTPMGPRSGAMYTNLEREAREAGLLLHWPSHLPNTLSVLAAAEWVRRFQPEKFSAFHEDLFHAHFVLGEDLGDPSVVQRYASALGIDVKRLHAALSDGSAVAAVKRSEDLGRGYGVHGTPAWLIAGRLISGLLSATEFERIAKEVWQRKS
jgi:predicted DsbA family dithiol-disulfide isomerase